MEIDIQLIALGLGLFVGFFGTTAWLMLLDWYRWRKHARYIRSACKR